MPIAIPAAGVRRHHIYLASHEYTGTVNMRQIAHDHIAEHGPKRPNTVLIVTVHEHAGWFCTYVSIDGVVTCISTANRSAVYDEEVDAVRRMLKTLPTVADLTTTFRRPERVIPAAR